MTSINTDNIIAEAMAQLAAVFKNEAGSETIIMTTSDALWAACKKVGTAAGIDMLKPSALPTEGSTRKLLASIANSSRFRFRLVTLAGKWWQYDNGPLLVFEQATQKPLALIMESANQYTLIDPATGRSQLLTPELASTLAIQAFYFYRTLPDTTLNLKALLTFTLIQQKRDFIRLLALQVFMGLLGLIIPIATGIILDTVVPNASINLLMQFVFGLVAITFAIAAFSAAQALVLIRIRFKTNAATQAAVWDRLLRLPATFFHDYSPGDLMMRAGGIDLIQQEISGAAIQAVLGGIFSFLTLGLMFYYSFSLALGATGLAIIIALLTLISARIQLKYQRPIAYLQGKLTALTQQFLNSIGKLRLTGSEPRAFALWAKQFAEKNHLFYQASIWFIRFALVRSLFFVLALIWLYSMIATKITPISFGSFIAFNAAFGQFFAAILALTGVITSLIRLIPLYERIKPILAAPPELERAGIDPGSLTGHIEIANVSFRYTTATPLVLENITLAAKPGEMIALVGATGSGKSTLFRLLLGFETPTKGSILYDNHELAKLNIRAVREQLGVVLQNGSVLPGTIFENIVGSYQLTQEDAWEALRLVGLAQDVEAMPMGLHTLVTEGGKTLSTGQRQRLMIARAIIHKPRILFLDEATSALDNPTQAEIMENLQGLNITRIIAAHRLSTLQNADRIYVLVSGQITQTGTYDLLLTEKGPFAELVKRQLPTSAP